MKVEHKCGTHLMCEGGLDTYNTSLLKDLVDKFMHKLETKTSHVKFIDALYNWSQKKLMMFHNIQTLLVLTFESEFDTETNFESFKPKSSEYFVFYDFNANISISKKFKYNFDYVLTLNNFINELKALKT